MAFWDKLIRWIRADDPARAESAPDTTETAVLDERDGDDAAPDNGETGWWTPQGEPVLEPPGAAGRMASIRDDLYQVLTAVLRDPDVDLPKLPQVANQALSMLSGESCDFRKLSSVISRDPALCAQVLRVANSVAYRGIKEIVQLEPAFVRMGVRGVRALLLTANVRGLAIRTVGERTLGQEIWRRSIASGVIVSSLARRFRLSEDDAFLVGLLHDIGDFALVRIVYDHQKAHGRGITRPVFDALSAQWHEHLGLRLADAWNLPDPLPQLIGQHHGAPLDTEPERTFQWLIQLSDAACAMMRYSPYVPYDFFNLMCVRELGLRNNAPTRALLAELPGRIDDRLASF